MFGLGMSEMLMIAGLALLFVGPKKLPELGRGIGEAIKGFRQSVKDQG